MTNPLSSSEGLIPPPKEVLAFDPGKSTGWSEWGNEKGTYVPRDFGTCRSLNELEEFLIGRKIKPDLVIYEDFKLFKWKALQQSGSKMEATRAIGSITLWAKMNAIPVVSQSPQILSIAPKWSKMPMPKNHDVSHHISAYNHAVYYLVSNGLMDPIGM